MRGWDAVRRETAFVVDIDEVAASRIQAAFEVQNQRYLIYPGDLEQQNLYHLTRLVATRPECLATHVRRIFLSINSHNRTALLGALVDLTLVLRGRGRALFERLLSQAEEILGERLKTVLDKAFQNCDLKQVMRLPLDHSVLSNGHTGTIFRI